MVDWDRTHQWIVTRIHRTRIDGYAVIHPKHIASQLMQVRAICESFRELPPKQIVQSIRSNRLLLGRFSPIAWQKIRTHAGSLGLEVIAIDASITSYLKFDKTNNSVLLIEDGAISEIVANEMLTAGAELQIEEVD